MTYKREKTFNAIPERNSEYIITKEYDGNGNQLAEVQVFNEDTIESYRNFQSDQFTNTIYYEVCDSSGHQCGYNISSYLDYNKPLIMDYQIPLGTSDSRWEYSYDSLGNLVEWSFFSYDVLHSEIINPRHDNCGNLIYYEVVYGDGSLDYVVEERFYDFQKPLYHKAETSGGSISEIEYSYNNRGWEIGQKYYHDGEFGSEYKNYTHDLNGNIIHYEIVSPDGFLRKSIDQEFECF